MRLSTRSLALFLLYHHPSSRKEPFLPRTLSWFPAPVVMNEPSLVASNNRNFFSPSSGDQKSEISITGLKIKVSERPHSLRRLSGRLSSCLWQLRVAPSIPCVHITPGSAPEVPVPSPLLSELSLCLPLIKTLGFASGSHSDNPGEYPHFKSLNLITSAKFLPYKVPFTDPRD